MAIELSFHCGTLQLVGIDQDRIRQLFPDVSWNWDRRSNCWRTHAIHYDQVQGVLSQLGPEYLVRDQAGVKEIEAASETLPRLSKSNPESKVAANSSAGDSASSVPQGASHGMDVETQHVLPFLADSSEVEVKKSAFGHAPRPKLPAAELPDTELPDTELPDTGLPAAEQTPWQNSVPKWQEIRWPKNALPKLRVEQRDAVESWQQTGRGCVVMATGTGKTEVALAIMARLGVSTLVVAPVRDLMYQWERRIAARLGYAAGIIGDSRFDVRPVSVTTYDSASIHMEAIGDRFQLLVFDECHHLPGNMRQESALLSAAPYRLGLTATPERSDGRHDQLDELIGPVSYTLPISKAAGKTLANYRVIRMPIHLSETEKVRYKRYSRVIQDYVAKQRQLDPYFQWESVFKNSLRDPEARKAVSAFRIKRSIEDHAQGKLRILEDLFRLHVGEPVIVFAGTNAMAREVSRRFLVPCLLSHCGKEERREVLQGFEAGDYPVLVANQVLDEGVDLPEVKVAIVIGGTSSERQSKQRLGRILRKSKFGDATLYEVVTHDTADVRRSRTRRRNDAFQRSSTS